MTEGHLVPADQEKSGASSGDLVTQHQSYRSPTTSKAAVSETVSMLLRRSGSMAGT